MWVLKTIITQLKAFILAQKAAHWILLLLFGAAGIYINYFCGMKKALKSLDGMQAFAAYFILYAVHTLFGYLLYSLFYKNFSFWKRPGFIILLFLSFCIFAFRSSFYEHGRLIELISSPENAYINRLTFGDLFRLSYLIVPISIIWFIAHRDQQPLYGFSTRNHKWKTYFILLACMVPLVAFASTQADFLETYPKVYKLEQLGVPAWKLCVYELCYGLDFVSIELFFRGFMIMAFVKYVGVNSVLPVACFYLSIHFGKPMGEAISSFFGGTILGLISYHTRSIYGGIMVHVGIAWLMEIGGIIGRKFLL